MNLNHFGWPLWLLGLAALAGLLYLLQRLRVRHREQIVITTLFWQEAKEEARARTLVERFRHPLAYLLALLLVGLAWLAFADPSWRDLRGMRYTVLLDASQEMSVGGRFEAGKEEVLSLARSLPRQRTEVILCGAGIHTLLAPGEDRSLLEARLKDIEPDAAPRNVARAMQLYGGAQSVQNKTANRTLVVVGFEPEASVPLAEGVQWTHSSVGTSIEPDPNDGSLASVGLAPSALAWNQVDVSITVWDGEGALRVPQVQLGDVDWNGAVRRTETPGGSHYLLDAVPAEGSLLTVTLPGTDSNPANDRAVLRLPNRPLIQLFVDPSITEPALLELLAVIPAIERTTDRATADVVVVAGGTEASAVPSLRWVPASEQEQALLIQHEDSLDSNSVLRFALGEFGLDRIDATEMATRAGKPIALGAQVGAVREVRVWRELLNADSFGLVESRAFPILVTRALHWLAQSESVVPYVAAGMPVPMPIGAGGKAFAADGEYLPTVAGEFQTRSGSILTASLLKPFAETPWAGTEPVGSESLSRGFWSPLTWALLLLLLLLLVEWALFSQGQIP